MHKALHTLFLQMMSDGAMNYPCRWSPGFTSLRLALSGKIQGALSTLPLIANDMPHLAVNIKPGHADCAFL